ncbi:F234B protein, partial [Amia calva]|nr:F234B protein [Amia calva]
MIVGVTQPANHSTGSQGSGKVFSVVALSSVGGVTVWTAMVPEPVLWVQCGLGGAVPGGPARLPMCLSIGSTRVSALNYSTGSVLWSVSPGEVVSPAIALPDLTGDAVSDLLIATLPADQVSDLSLLLLSGASGSRIGRPVTFNLTAQGKLIGPELHLTKVGAHYILFGLGTVEAASLKDIYIQASGRPPLPRSLRQKDPSWERLRTANSSTLIHISSGSVQVDFLLPLVVGSVNCSDWALVCGGGLSVLGGGDAHTVWSIRTLPLHSRPVPGHFNGDMTLDLLVQSSPFPRVRKVQVIDGSTGRSLWEAEFSCSLPELEGVAVRTSTGQSAFLFWAGELRPTSNVSKATVSPGAPVSHRLYLLHPTYPTILLQLTETTDTPLTMAVSYVGQREDAFYMMVASRPVPGLTPAAQVVSGLGLRGAVAGGTPVWLGPPQPGSFEVNKFYKGLSFVQNQV